MGSFVKWLSLALLPLVLAQDYCSVCSDHTMCVFKSKSALCGGNSVSGVSSSEAAQIVKLHNDYRSRIANGLENRGKSGPQPPASNMRAFAWDEKLAEVAQRWADQCTYRHDRCRNDPRFKVGQNMLFSSGLPAINWTRAISAWYDEVEDFDGHRVGNFRSDHRTRSYTQLAWATTTLVGCARTAFRSDRKAEEHVPREFVLSALPSGPEAEGAGQNGNLRVKKQYHLGFFGGASFDPAGSQGAITGSSGDFVSSSGANRPSRPPPENLPTDGFNGNYGNIPNFPAAGNRPIYPSAGNRPIFPVTGNRPIFPVTGNRPIFPVAGSLPNYPSYPDYSESSYEDNDAASYSSQYYYPGTYYQLYPTHHRDSGQYSLYASAGLRPYFASYAKTNGFATRLAALGLFNGEADKNFPLQQTRMKLKRSNMATSAGEKKTRISRRTSTDGIETSIDFDESSPTDQILICNYGPAGNEEDQPIYIEGEACSKCPLGTTCQNGLCATV